MQWYQLVIHFNLGAWCWFNANEVGLRFGTFYAWVFACITYNVVAATIVLYFIKKKQKQSGFKLSKRTLQSAKNQLLYIAALCIAYGPSSITRIVQTFSGQEVFWLQIIQALTLPLQGFLNCIIYLTIRRVILRKYSFVKSTKSANYSKLNTSATNSLEDHPIETTHHEDI